jgi:uncharacterized protein YjbI with pentapeptide repeats
MARPWLTWLSRIGIALAVIFAALALPWVVSSSWFQRWWLSRQWNGWILIAIAIDAAVVLLAAIWWLWWRLPRRQVTRLSIQIPDPKERADVEDNFRKTVGQALGGAVVLIGAVVAYLQFTQQQQASRDLLISNQVAKGFEQLAGEKIAMRLGGIYALEGVMNTSSDYHQPVLEAVCAFVRDSTTQHHVALTALMEAMFTSERDSSGGKAGDKPPNDIQAALTVIGRRKQGPGRVNLARANIPGAYLIGANLDDANLDDANLDDATLIGAHLSHTTLIGAHLNGANLRGAHLDDAILEDATLIGAHLNDANLSGAHLNGANLSGADLIDATLSHAKLSGVHLKGANLLGAHLENVILEDANLSGANLYLANLSGAHLSGAYLSHANLRGAHLDDAYLSHATLSDAHLERADLTDADLTDADLSGADLSGADLSGADLSGAKNLTQGQLNQACGTHVTLPEGKVQDLKPCPPLQPVAPPLNPGTTP